MIWIFEFDRLDELAVSGETVIDNNFAPVRAFGVGALHLDLVTVDDLEMQSAAGATDLHLVVAGIRGGGVVRRLPEQGLIYRLTLLPALSTTANRLASLVSR